VGSLAAVIVSAGAYTLLFPPFDLAWLSWIALVPLLLAVRGQRPAAAAALTGLWGLLMTAAIIAWLVPTLHLHFQRSMAWSVLFLLLFSAVVASPFYAAACALYAWTRPHLPRAMAPLLLVAAWVAAEYARTHFGFRSPWAKLGDAHHASERLRQLAALTGVYGVSSVVVLGNVAAVEAIAVCRRWLRGRSPDFASAGVAAGVFGLVCTASLVYGETRRIPEASPTGSFDVAIVQGNVLSQLRWTRFGAARVVRRYTELTRTVLVDPGGDEPDLVLWPENAIQTSLDDPVYGLPVRALVRGGVPILLGAPRSEVTDGARRHFNSAFLLRPDGPVEHYDKRRLLTFSETRAPLVGLPLLETGGSLDAREYTAGTRPGLFDLDGRRLSVQICFEIVYPELSREAARNGATVLVNLSNDGWYRGRGGAQQHLAQAVLRAVETGLPLVRATTTGVSAVVAPDGTIVADLGEGVTGTLRAAVPSARSEPTFYTRVGDAFAIGCVLTCVLAPFARFRRCGRRVADEGPRDPRTGT